MQKENGRLHVIKTTTIRTHNHDTRRATTTTLTRAFNYHDHTRLEPHETTPSHQPQPNVPTTHDYTHHHYTRLRPPRPKATIATTTTRVYTRLRLHAIGTTRDFDHTRLRPHDHDHARLRPPRPHKTTTTTTTQDCVHPTSHDYDYTQLRPYKTTTKSDHNHHDHDYYVQPRLYHYTTIHNHDHYTLYTDHY